MANKTSINKECKDRKTSTWSAFKSHHPPCPSMPLISWWTANHQGADKTSLRMVWEHSTAIMMIWLKRLQSLPPGLFSKASRFRPPWANRHSSSSKTAWRDSPWWCARTRCRGCLNPTWVGSWTGTHLWPTTTTCRRPQGWCPTTFSWMEIINYQTIRETISTTSTSEEERSFLHT